MDIKATLVYIRRIYMEGAAEFLKANTIIKEALPINVPNNRFFLLYPPKSSSIMSSGSTPRSISIFITEVFIIGGPHI